MIWAKYQREQFAHSNDELYCDIAEDVWDVFTDIVDGFKTAHEIACNASHDHSHASCRNSRRVLCASLCVIADGRC